jgi:hypothetical protein
LNERAGNEPVGGVPRVADGRLVDHGATAHQRVTETYAVVTRSMNSLLTRRAGGPVNDEAHPGAVG